MHKLVILNKSTKEGSKFNRLFDTSIDFSKRVFYVLAGAGLAANLVGLTVNFFLPGGVTGMIVCTICTLIVAAFAVYGIKTGKLRLPSAVILGLVTCFEYPVLYLFLGSAVISFMVMGLAVMLAYFGKHSRVKIFTATAAFDIAVIILRYIIKDSIPVYEYSFYFWAALFSFITATVTMLLLLLMFIRQGEAEKEQLKKMADDLQTAARLDPMTGLFNRLYLTEYCSGLIEENKSFCAALIDLDDCAKLNDEYGVSYTDMIITEFSTIVNNAVSGAGITARYGGQKFMVIYLGNERRLEDLLDNVRKEYAAYSMTEKQREFTFSSGVVSYEEGVELTRFYSITEEKLLRAKRKGKNTFVSA